MLWVLGGALLATIGFAIYAIKSINTARNDTDEAFNKLLNEKDKRALAERDLIMANNNVNEVRLAFAEEARQVVRSETARKYVEDQYNAFKAKVAKGDVTAGDLINDSLSQMP